MNHQDVVVTSIGKRGTETSFRIQCQYHIDREIENKEYTWLQLERVLQNIQGKGIATLFGHIKEKGDVILKVQLAAAAQSEWDFAERLKDLPGFIDYTCYVTCAGDAKYILCKTVLYIFQAYQRIGFTHGDLFAKNIVLSDETEPLIIDFEKSSLSKHVQRFWRDLDDLFGDVGRYVMGPSLDEIARNRMYMSMAYNKEPKIEDIRNICKDLQSIEN